MKPLEQTSTKKRNTVPITLDRLEWGTNETVEAELKKSKKERKTLPDSVSSKDLYGDILKIAWPSLCELFLTSLVMMINTMMVGGLGTDAISAVSLAGQPRFIFMNLVMALNTGATAMVSRARGMQNQERANAIMRQSLVFVTIISIASLISGYYSSEWLIRFMANGGLSDSVISAGTKYLQVQFLFFPISSWTICITAILKGTGQAKPSLYYNSAANVVNILFNWLLIEGNLGFPRLEVMGSAIATGIGQTVGFILAMYVIICGKSYARLQLSFSNIFKFDKEIISGILKVGIPSMIEQFIMRFGVIIYTRTVASLGSIEFATHNIAMNIQSMSFMIGQGLAVSSTSLVGQSLGKRRLDMAEYYSHRCRMLGLYISFVTAVVIVIFGKPLIGLYNKDAQVLALGATLMYYVAVLQPFQSNQFIIGGSLRGAGDTKFTAFVMLVTVIGLRTGLGLLLVNVFHLGLNGAWIALSADQIARTLLVTWRYNQGKWKAIRL